MSIFSKIFKRNRPPSNINTRFSNTGDTTISRDSTSFIAVDLIASAFANLSGHFYNTNTKQIIKDHSLYDVLNNPNIDETKFQFFYNCVKDYYNGNVFIYKYDNDQGETVALFRLSPNEIKVTRNFYNQKVFTYKGIEYSSEKILHIPSRFGYDGLIGKSIFTECSQIFANSSELDAFINNSFNNSVGNRLIIDITKEYPNATEEQIQQLKNKFLANYTGIKNAGKPLIKSGKIDYANIETAYKDNRANQLVENRQFQEREIAKLFGIPLSLISGGQQAIQEDIESIYILFLENAIKPLATSFEQSINKLIPLNERSRIYFEYNYNNLQKTSITTRVETYSKQLMSGILTPNEIRRKENLEEVEAGDNIFLPSNLMPLTDEVVNSFMASAKLKMKELENTNTDSPGIQGNHSTQGDDKGM